MAVWTPAIVYSGALIFLFGWSVGRWVGGGITLMLWLLVAAAALRRDGERALVALVFQAETLDIAETFGGDVESALRDAIGPEFERFDWYLRDSDEPNALAVGGHTIMVTTSIAYFHGEGLLADSHVVAILLHEYGHHRGGQVRGGAMLVPLVYLWFLTGTFLKRMRGSFEQQKPSDQLILTLFAVGLVVAAVVALLARPLLCLGLVLLVLLVTVVLPALAAKGKRADELRADQVAVSFGYGPPLRGFLEWWLELTESAEPATGFRRLMASHPDIAVRAAQLPQNDELE